MKCGSELVWEPGLPAMQAPRCISYTAVMLSQASQLPHKPAPTLVVCSLNQRWCTSCPAA
ncbi:hypothetical protein C1751_19945 [Pseudomonas fluorescens]|nr:hypothetical protein C1751_19945 [Pseudomonas fluorescens]